MGLISFSYDPVNDRLLGNIRIPPSEQVARSVELHRGQALHYFRDYARYLQSRHITFHEYKTVTQQRVGRGYAIYLPDNYEIDVQKTWPLIVFLIGTGERGHSLSLLTKHGPLRVVLNGQPLPFIIVSPMLEVSTEFRSFPESYLDNLLQEILSEYRVDSQRVYLTGLSMGGEATYRYALHRPDLFAALAPLAGFTRNTCPQRLWQVSSHSPCPGADQSYPGHARSTALMTQSCLCLLLRKLLMPSDRLAGRCSLP